MSVWISRIMRQISTGVVSASQEMNKSYEEAVRALNTLQSNAAVIEQTKRERDRNRHLNVPQTIGFAERTGLSLDDLDKLSIIHVSGTKGKGSTCAFSERILREHGFKTGFFSSPHLVEVRERIRINGRPLSKDMFSSYFWDCFNKLESTKEAHGGTMPAYFRFLTIMAFQVFLQEQVDVAIIEVGIGGQYDCTNIIRSPVVCGVTSLDYDHTAILGDTLEQIAWQKGGIFKRGVPAVTVPQPGNSLQVLIDRAKEIQVPLEVVPPLDDYTWASHERALGIPGDKQRLNASLALQLCKTWLEDHSKSKRLTDREEKRTEYLSMVSDEVQSVKIAEQFKISEKTGEALALCEWPGRGQRIRRPGVTFYLDGAHTPSSIENCINWYKKVSNEDLSALSGNVVKLLLFNSTGYRKPEDLLQGIALECDFDCAVFSPNIASSNKPDSADQTSYMVTTETQLERVACNKDTWLQLLKEKARGSNSSQNDLKVGPQGDHNPKDLTDEEHAAYTFTNLQDALACLSRGTDPFLPAPNNAETPNGLSDLLEKADHVQVLCTGSLHMIGVILRLISPEFNDQP